MTTELPRPLNRQQLAAVFKNHEALIAFERMFQTVSITFPSTMSDMTIAIAAAALSGDMAGEKANLALALLSQIASSLDVIASAPPVAPPAVNSSDMQLLLTAPRYTMDPKLANTRALSVLGGATAVPGEALPIVAGADGQVLLRNGTLAFVAPVAPAAGLTISTALVFALVNDLAAVEGLAGTGMPARTAVDAWALRTHTGSASITVTNGDGVAASPGYSVNATWVGQASITTLGTITTGTWTGTAIAAINGGTGFTTYTLGDTVYSDAANSLAKLAGNITTTKKFLRQTGSGAASAAPAWDTIVAGDVQAIAPTWSAQHIYGLAGDFATPAVKLTSARPVFMWEESDAAADNQRWGMQAQTEQWQFRTVTDNAGVTQVIMTVDRTGVTVDDLTFGNATGNPTFTFAGSGTATFTGPISAPRVVVTGATIPANGMYLPAANKVGFATNSGLRMTIDATGNVSPTSSPLSKSITQVFTGVGAYRTADTTANSATLAADTDLTLTVNETGHYKIDIELSFYEATAGTGGFQFDLNSGTATVASFFLDVIGFGTALFGNAGITSAATATGVGTVVTSSTAPSWIKATGYVNISGAGTIAIRWAQNTLLAIDPTTLKKGSSFLLTKVA